MLWTCPQGDSSSLELCSLKGVIGDFHRDETDRFQCLHLQWRIETPLRVEPSPVSSTTEGSVHQPAVSQLCNTPHSPSHTWVELWPCTSCPAWDPLPSIVGSSTQRCLPFMGWRLDAIAEVKESPSAVAPVCVCRGIQQHPSWHRQQEAAEDGSSNQPFILHVLRSTGRSWQRGTGSAGSTFSRQRRFLPRPPPLKLINLTRFYRRSGQSPAGGWIEMQGASKTSPPPRPRINTLTMCILSMLIQRGLRGLNVLSTSWPLDKCVIKECS